MATGIRIKVDEDEAPEQLEWYDALRKLLAPYEPAATAAEADKLYSTPEIRQALESHYGIMQGGAKPYNFIDGIELVEQIEALGFKFENTGELQFHWLMKNKV